jgi:hypothetical protein
VRISKDLAKIIASERETNASDQSHENCFCQSSLESGVRSMDAAFRRRQNSRASTKELQPRHPVKTAAHKPARFPLNSFNRVCGNNRAASVYGDDAKSKNPGGLARVSGQRNSLRTAIEFLVVDPSYSHWHRRFHWTQQNGQRIEATCFS